MKKLFAILISLASLSANSLQTSAVAPHNMAPAPTTPEAWTQSINLWVNTITRVSDRPVLPWRSLLWDVLNFTSGSNDLTTIWEYGPPRDTEPLNEGTHNSVQEHIHYKKNKKFHSKNVVTNMLEKGEPLDNFKHAVQRARDEIKQQWDANPTALTIQQITATKQGLDVFIAQLANAQSQLVSDKNTNILNTDENMNKCKAFFEQDFKLNDVSNYSQNFYFSNKKGRVRFKVDCPTIQELVYPTLSSNLDAKALGAAVTQLKENLIRWALFIKKTTNYSAFNAGSANAPFVFNAGNKILALTPQIITYLQRASLALGVMINNYRVNQQLFDQNIAKITQAISR